MRRASALGAALVLLGAGAPAHGLPDPDDPPAPAAGPAASAAVGDASPDDTSRAEPEADPEPSPEDLDLDGAVIGAVEIRIGDIFDPALPGEDRLLFRLADRAHRRTRDHVIAQQLLFKEGDRYDRRLIEESARLLRENRYLRNAEIIPVRVAGNRVDLAVVSRDVWTLNAGFGLGRGGGVNSTHFQVQDYNLLGTGKGLQLLHTSDVDRTSTEVSYGDQNLLGSRWRLDAALADNSDGSHYSIIAERPFFSLDSHWTAGLKTMSDDRTDSLYDLGEITEQFRQQTDMVEISAGLSHGLVGNRVHRWTTGFTYRRDRFDLLPGVPAPVTMPEDRTLAYPWIAFDSLQDDFMIARDQNRLGRVEDLELGLRAHARLGYSSTAFGATREQAIFDAGIGRGMRPSGRQTLLLAADLSGRWGAGGAEHLKLDLGTSYYWRDFGDHLFFAALKGSLATRLDPEIQILLGGDSGLRGYPLRYQAGDSSLLLTLEQRFFTNLNPWKLFRVGAAVFFDAGGVWGDHASGFSNLGLLKDIGVGLRLGSTRSGRGSVVHLDIAFPLDGDGSIRSLQWLIKSKETF